MTKLASILILSLSCGLFASSALAFNSGSTGADGAFNPTASTELQLPPNGVFNFTDVNIPAGVTVSFTKNAANTPVYILASGDINVAGAIQVNANGQSGGPGGYDGGKGGLMYFHGESGKGPGGGGGGCYFYGGDGSYGVWGGSNICANVGVVYGSPNLVPLIGGSGGGGSAGGDWGPGRNGGGGGGALLLAASGKINLTGALYANGSDGPSSGKGSGGAIRLVASTIDGNGAIQALSPLWGHGRIRLEAEYLLRTVQTNPNFTFSSPREVFPAALPSLRFVSVAGVAAPAQPTGNMDVSLPADIGNPVTVVLASSGVPLGSSIKLLSSPEYGAQAAATSTPISGSEADGTASAQINIADGKSTLIASVGFTVTAALGQELAPYAEGEPVLRVELSAGLQGGSSTKLITASGKEFLLPPSAQPVLTQ